MKTVTDDDDLMMITSDGIVIRLDTAEISTYGRNTQGVRLMRLDDDVRVVSIARAEKDSQEEDSTDSENAEESEE
jgi:DNA gyrase subunit A